MSSRARRPLFAGRYRLERTWVAEGPRRVWRAVDTFFSRPVVVKGVQAAPGEQAAEAIRDEYHRLVAFRHPAIARPYDFGWTEWQSPEEPRGGTFTYFTQEWIAGTPLSALCGRLDPEAVQDCIVELLQVVAFLHDRRLICLDLKPDHLIETRSRWRLIDLDQARIEDPLAEVEPAGTLHYLAPELLAGRDADVRSDLYSIGAILYEALSGAPPPIAGATVSEVARNLEASPIPPLPDPVVERAPALASLAHTLLARNPADRPASAGAVLGRLCGGGEQAWRNTSPLPESRLVGRTGALTRLDRLEETAASEGGGWITVLGPPRSGRTRFLEEVVARWHAGGVQALRLNCRSLPRQEMAAVRIMLQYLAVLGRQQPPGQEPGRSFLLDASKRLESTPGETLDQLVLDALGRLLHLGRAAFEQTGAVTRVVLDDVDQVDELSGRVLARLRPHLAGSGLVLCVARSTVADGAVQEGPAVVLEPLDTGEVRVLGEDVLGPGGLDEGEVEHLVRTTGGVVGWVRDALEARWKDPGFSFEAWAPASVPAVSALLGSIPEESAWVAEVVCVLDRQEPFSVLQYVVRQAAQAEGRVGVDVRQALTVLVRAGLLEECAGGRDGAVHYRFAREPARRVLESSLGAARRQERHRWAAEAIERAGGERGPDADGALAAHFLAAGMPERARVPLRNAFVGARDRLWLSGAVRYLEQLASIAGPEEPGWQDIHVELGELLYELGRYPEARQAFETGLGTGISRAEPLTARCLAGLARALMAQGRTGRAREKLEAALAQGTEVSPEDRLRWWFGLVWLALSERDTERADVALARAEAEGIPPESWAAVSFARYRAWLAVERGQADRRVVAMLEEALDLARELEYRRGESDILNLLVRVCEAMGEGERAERFAHKAVARARADFDLAREASSTLNLGYLTMRRGDLSSALAHFERAAHLQRRLGNRQAEARSLMAAAELLLELRKTGRARDVIERAAGLLGSETPAAAGTREWLELLQARVAIEEGKVEDAREHLDALEGALAEDAPDELRLSWHAARMALARHAGKPLDVLTAWRAIPSDLLGRRHLFAWRRIHGLAAEAHWRLGREGGPEHIGAPGPGGGPSGKPGPTTPPLPRGSLRRGGSVRLEFPPSRERSDWTPSQWIERIHRLLSLTGEDELLAAELARQAGELLSGRGLVFIFEGARPLVVSGRGMSEEQVDDVSRSIIERVRRARRSFVCDDVLSDREVGRLRSLRAAGVRSVVCSPVVRDNVCVGVIYVDRQQPSSGGASEAVAMLEKVAGLASELLARPGKRQAGAGRAPDDFDLVGDSAPMQRLKERMAELTEVEDPDLVVLLQGATGTGKSLVARRLHQFGTRKDGPFHVVDCAAIPDGLVEELMFGHVGGVFTGARHARPGWFEQADKGTLVLDEIGEMPMEQQRRLLATLGSRKFTRLGEVVERDLDVHLVCATNRDLRSEVAQGRFRGDLLRRIFVNVLYVPSLKERGERDILLLARHFITGYLKRHQLIPEDAEMVPLEDYLAPSAVAFLRRYHWPWNVGEMENLFRNGAIRRVLRSGSEGPRRRVGVDLVQEALCVENRARVGVETHVRAAAEEQGERLPEPSTGTPVRVEVPFELPEDVPYSELLAACERWKRDHILRVYESCGRKLLPTAERLQASRDVIRRYVKRQGR